MSAAWPEFWQHIPDEDRGAISDILTTLLSSGVLLGEEGRGRQLYQTARQFEKEISDYLAPLHIQLLLDPDRPILQARPVAGDCGLTERFSKAATLVVLVLWRIYDEKRLTETSAAVIIPVEEICQRLKLYFENVEPPSSGQLERILQKLKSLNLIRTQARQDVQKFGETLLEILPSLPRVIPFEHAEAWEQQAALYRGDGETTLEEPS